MTFEDWLRFNNRTMIGFDLALGTGTLLAPRRTLRLLGHDHPNEDAEKVFQRLGPIWLTFAAAHLVADRRGEPRDWWALAWLRGTEIATDVLWSSSPYFRRPGARAGLWFAGAANVAMALGYGRLAKQTPRGRAVRALHRARRRSR